MANLQAVYYGARDGSEPVNDFIDRLTVKRQVALDNQIDRLNMLTASSPHLPFPHSSQIEGGAPRAEVSLRARALPDPVSEVPEPHRPPTHLPQGHRQDS